MASQIIAFPPAIFETVHRQCHRFVVGMGQAGFALEPDHLHRATAIAVHGAVDAFDFELCHLDSDWPLVLLLVPDGNFAAHNLLPVPLPDQLVLHLIDAFEPLLDFAAVTGHEALTLAAAFSRARNCAPIVDRRPASAPAAELEARRRLAIRTSDPFSANR